MKDLEYNLPEAVTLKRLFTQFNLAPVRDNFLLAEELMSLPIGSIDFPEGRISLPFLGKKLSLIPQGQLFRLDIRDEDLSLMVHLPGTWEELATGVGNWLEQEKGRILGFCEEYTRHLTELITQGHGLSILGELRKLLGMDVFLLDKYFKVLVWEGGKDLPLNPLAFVTPKLSNFKTLDLSIETPLSPGSWNEAQYKKLPLSWYPLAGYQGVLGYIGLCASPDELSPVAKLLFYKTATLLYLELTKAQSVEDTERQHYRDFLFDLLYNNFDSLEVVQSRGKLWGMDLTKPHMVVVGEIPGYDPDSRERVFFQELMDRITAVLKSQPRTVFLERNDQIVLLYPLESMLPLKQWEGTAKKLLSPLLTLTGELEGGRTMVFGVGNIYPSARFIHRSFQEAKSALELGLLFDVQERVILFQDLGVMRLLLKLEQQELEDFRNEVLGPLLKFDQENNLHLEETLLAYLASDGDLNRAGDRLFLHPNTLRYRLKKATEVLERDLNSLENKMNLYIALKIGRLKSLWQE